MLDILAERVCTSNTFPSIGWAHLTAPLSPPSHVHHNACNVALDLRNNAPNIAIQWHAEGNTDIFSLLLEHDMDVDNWDGVGMTSLHWASYCGTLSVGQDRPHA
jgi:hypothetical protein